VADAVALSYELRLGRSLAMALTATNPGEAPITIEEALHTYLSVSDVRRVSVEGLRGATYLDKVDGATRKTQAEDVIIVGSETDRLYLDARRPSR